MKDSVNFFFTILREFAMIKINLQLAQLEHLNNVSNLKYPEDILGRNKKENLAYKPFLDMMSIQKMILLQF